MTARTVPALFAAFALSAAFAQTTPPAKPAAPETKKAEPETPPDRKAYTEANKITDPEKKIEALEKWKRDFPESQMLEAADDAIFSTLIRKLPDQQPRIRRFAASMYRNAKPKAKGSVADGIADDLLNANLLLKDAESYAKKGVDAMKLAPYLQEQLAGYEKRKQKPPSPEELHKRFLQMRASRVATLGLVEYKLGRTAQAKKLLEESYAANPSNGAVLSALGEMAAKAGDDAKALDYLVPARLSGRATREAGAAFESIYKKQHNGSVDGLESMLDAEYHKRFPNPVKVEPYKPGEKRSDRVVLVEVFTGSGCPPCAGADVAFDAAMERYSRKDVAVLMYHEHVPRPDPMTNPDTQARSKAYDVRGVPSYAIDGKLSGGGNSRDHAREVYDRFNPGIEKELETPAEAHITAGVNLHDKVVRVHAAVRGVTGDPKDDKLYIGLVEKELRYNGENGIRFHPMVVRALRSIDLAGGQFDQSFDLDEIGKAIKAHLDDYEAKGHRGEAFKFSEKKYEIDPHDLAVVLFVQNEKTRHVLQAGYVDLGPEATPTSAN